MTGLRGKRAGRKLAGPADSYFALMVTVNALFAGLVSMPLNVAEPVTGMVPAAATLETTVTTIVCPPPIVDAVQVMVPEEPGTGPWQEPIVVLTDTNANEVGSVVVKLTRLAAVLWLSLICQVNVSRLLTDGPPFCAAPVT